MKNIVEKVAKQKDVNKAFKKFIEEPIPKELEYHTFLKDEVVIRLFEYIPPKGLIMLVDGSSASNLRSRMFPFGKVLAAGPDSKYEVGTIIKLRDMDAMTVENPDYKMWKMAEDKGPMLSKRVGQEPPPFIDKLATNRYLNSRVFFVNPLNLEFDEQNWVTFRVVDSDIEEPIKDPYVFIV